MDNMPDFDSMTPEEMMAWMEALAKRQGATEGLLTSGDMEVPEIDPATVGEIDEPGYIPFGMDPEVWAQKKAIEDAERAERIAVMKADKEKTAAQRIMTPPPAATPVPPPPAAVVSNPLDFLADLSGVNDSPDTAPFVPVDEPVMFEAAADEVPLEDLFADLSDAEVEVPSGDMDWLSSLGQSADVPSFDDLDFGSFEALDQQEAQGADNALEWLESLVGSGDSDKVNAVAEPEDMPVAAISAAEDMDDMLLEGDDILEDSAVSAVLNDPMEWLADFADTRPMDEIAQQSAAGREVPSMSEDMDAFFDRIHTADGDELPAAVSFAEAAEATASGLLDFGGAPDFGEEEVNISSALTKGAEVPPEDVKAWMDSLLDRGIQRTDVTDEDEEELLAEVTELPSWLVDQVGTPPSTEEMLAASGDLPDWLTAPVTDEQSAEFEEMFNQMSRQEEAPVEETLAEFDSDVAPLDTGVIRVQMDDPWVEAFELERDERMSDTGRLAAWYESAAHEVKAAREADVFPATPVVPAASMSSMKAAQLPAEEELPHGEPQAIPVWLGGTADVSPLPLAVARDVQPEPAVISDEELPEWLRSAQVESIEVPTWLTESLSTDEFEILQLGSEATAVSETSIQDDPTTPVQMMPAAPVLTQTQQPQPLTHRPTAEMPRISTSQRPAREQIAAHEAAAVINQARASQKMGDIAGMLGSYERLVRSEVALEDVETDMEKVSKDAVHKTNPAVLRVYGDVLLRRGKLQQALDTYRAALNLL